MTIAASNDPNNAVHHFVVVKNAISSIPSEIGMLTKLRLLSLCEYRNTHAAALADKSIILWSVIIVAMVLAVLTGFNFINYFAKAGNFITAIPSEIGLLSNLSDLILCK